MLTRTSPRARSEAMPFIRLFAVLFPLLVLSACMTYWRHPVKGNAEFAQDDYRCTKESEYRYEYVNSDGSAGSEIRTDFYKWKLCMKALGWQQVKKNE